METTSSSPNEPSRVPVDGARQRHLAPVPAAAVMWEQLRYLLAHADIGWHPKCLECTRFELVRRYLLQPFS